MESRVGSYLDFLRQQREQPQHIKQLNARTKPTVRQVKPLADQIAELMASLPPAMRNRPWSMQELVQRLSGRYRARPHAQHVGDALRRLGWHRSRLWCEGGEGRRVWHYPTEATKRDSGDAGRTLPTYCTPSERNRHER